MNPWLERLYYHSPVFLQHVWISAQGYKLYRLRYGGAYERYLEELLRSERYSAAELRELQCARLQALVAHCCANVPYYQQLFGELKLTPSDVRQPEDLPKLPVLEKETVRSRPDWFLARDLRRAPCEIVSTSGSTGTTLRIPVNLEGRRQNYAFFGRLRQWAGAPLGVRTATFGGRVLLPGAEQRPPFWRHNWATRTLLFSSYHISDRSLPLYLAKLRAWQPELIDSYPSSAELLARYILQHDGPAPRPKALITSSETLSPEQRALISAAFQAPVFDQYGSAEQVAFISNCESGSYHIHPEFGITELLPLPGSDPPAAQIVATGFTNWALPLLRYNTGDLALLGDGACPCGRNFPRVERILGRMDDLVVTPDGRRVGRLDPVFKGLDSIRRAQIIQETTDTIRVRLVPAPGFSQERDTASIRHELSKRLGPDMRLLFEVLPDIPLGPGGKFRAVVSRVSSGPQATSPVPHPGS